MLLCLSTSHENSFGENLTGIVLGIFSRQAFLKTIAKRLTIELSLRPENKHWVETRKRKIMESFEQTIVQITFELYHKYNSVQQKSFLLFCFTFWKVWVSEFNWSGRVWREHKRRASAREWSRIGWKDECTCWQGRVKWCCRWPSLQERGSYTFFAFLSF